VVCSFHLFMYFCFLCLWVWVYIWFYVLFFKTLLISASSSNLIIFCFVFYFKVKWFNNYTWEFFFSFFLIFCSLHFISFSFNAYLQLNEFSSFFIPFLLFMVDFCVYSCFFHLLFLNFQLSLYLISHLLLFITFNYTS